MQVTAERVLLAAAALMETYVTPRLLAMVL